MTLPAGTRLGPYEILSPLGAGGMGEVYRARDERLKREVAIKVLPAAVSSDPDRLRRFEREAQATGALNHPNITAVYDIGQHKGAPYIVQELLKGETLRERLATGSLPARKAIEFGIQIAQGLSAAHGQGIVHRDLKPENLFLTSDERIKILDFGLAKLTELEPIEGVGTLTPTFTVGTEPGIVMGTVGYMSPEQVGGEAVDQRSDIFSFGAILYEMLSGNRAFRGKTAAETMAAIMRDEPPELSASGQNISPALDHVVRHCLEKDLENRFQTAKDVAFALSEQSSAVSAASGPQVAGPQARKNKVLVAAAAIVVLAIGSVLLMRRPPKGSLGIAGVKRVAVLPFENLGAPEDDYFADGMADAVRGKLTSLPGIQVIARSSSTPYRKTTKTPTQIAKELDTPYLLMATVRWQKSAGSNRVQVTPELVAVIESQAPASKWQQPFDAAMTDVFQVQADIATQVARALGVALGATDEKQISQKPTENLAAYDAFLKGEEASRKFYLKEARAAYERAISLDPHFAMAMLGLAQYSSDRDQQLALIKRAALERSRLTERESLHLDIVLAYAEGNPDVALKAARELYTKYPNDELGAQNLAFDELGKGKSDDAIKIFQKLLVVDPNNAQAYNQIGYYYGYRGDYDKALQYLNKYRLIEENSANPLDSLGEVQANSGRYQEAIENLNRALAIKADFAPAYQHLGVVYEGLGNYPYAVQNYEKAADLADSEGLRRDYLTMAVRAALFGKDRTALHAAVERAQKVPADPKDESSQLRPSILNVVGDLSDGRLPEAERRLRELKPKLEAAFEKNSNAGRVPRGLKPHYPFWNYLMARSLELQGRTDEALKLYEANANPPNPFWNFDDRRWIMEARAKVAEIVARKGDLDRAEKVIAENRKWNPSWAPNKPSELVVEQLRRDKMHSRAADPADSKAPR
jgi:tetratricopeptide (TPR) repeat protein/TolB-like protein